MQSKVSSTGPPGTSRSIGATALRVAPLGLGTAPAGNLYRARTDAEARSAIAAALASGFSLVDTAPYYGFGLSERRVGDVLRELPRDSFVLSTKVGRLLDPDSAVAGSAERHGFHSPMPFSQRFDYGYDAVMRSFESSMQRLGLARIDILLAHDIGALTHGPAADARFAEFMDGGYRALDELRSAGLIGAVGLGVNEWQVCERAMDHGRFDCFLLAGRYTLLEQTALDSFLPRCRTHGATVLAGGPFNSGILATGTRGPAIPYYDYALATPPVIERVRRIERVCDAHAVPLAAAALQFPIAHPEVSAVIAGAADAAEVERMVQSWRHPVPPEFWADLRAEGLLHASAPTPRRAAPELSVPLGAAP